MASVLALPPAEAAKADVDKACQHIIEELQHNNTTHDNECVISSPSELIGISARKSSRHSQPGKPYCSLGRIDGETTSPLQHTDPPRKPLACRPPQLRSLSFSARTHHPHAKVT